MDFSTEPAIHLQDLSLILMFPSFLIFFYVFIKYLMSRFNLHTWFSPSSETSLPNPIYPVSKTFNPFSLSLKECKEDQHHPVHLHLNTHVSCTVHLLWGCLIHQIYPHIHQEWNLFLNTNFYDNICLKYEKIEIPLSSKPPPLSSIIPLTIPPMNMGGLPRDKYPLVVVVDDVGAGRWGSNGGDDGSDVSSQQINSNKIGALISFIHLKDQLCPTHTHLFDQYVKTYAGYLHNIKPLFVPSSNEEDSEQPSELSTSTLPFSSPNVSSSSTSSITSTVNETFNPSAPTTRNRKKIIKDNQNIQNETLNKSDSNIINTNFVSCISSSQTTQESTIINHNDRAVNPKSILTTTSTASNLLVDYTPSQRKANCVVCLEGFVEMVILPCRHACVCVGCCNRLLNCPVCRGYIISTFAFEN